MSRLGGKDWDKRLACESCRKRPTECKCNDTDDIKIIFTIVIIAIISTFISISCCNN